MNDLCGRGRVSCTGWVPVRGFSEQDLQLPARDGKRVKTQQGSSKITCGHRNNKAKGGKSDTLVEVVRALVAPYRR